MSAYLVLFWILFLVTSAITGATLYHSWALIWTPQFEPNPRQRRGKLIRNLIILIVTLTVSLLLRSGLNT